MGRKKKRAKYRKGATWLDVLNGVPVLEGETAKKRVPGRCRSCRAVGMMRPGGGFQTCKKCGGELRAIPR